MDKLEKQLKDLPEIGLPDGLHGRIMRNIFIRRFRVPFLVVVLGVGANIVFSAWRIGMHVADTRALYAFQLLFAGFDASYDFIFDFLEMLKDYLPVTSSLIFFVNILLAIYLVYLYFHYRGYQGYQLRKVE